ncbi:MAG: hypothetical protein EBZ75_13260 [Oxalobacteraceae bacterium]|nr:hypothetical protein [Oxalobacteraceae bacterium]
MTPCIFYHPEAYTTGGPKLMGRNAAGESFLRGYLSHTRASEFWAQVQALDHAQHFASAVTQAGRTEPVKVVDRANLAALSGAGLVYYPGPGIGEHAFHRAARVLVNMRFIGQQWVVRVHGVYAALPTPRHLPVRWMRSWVC